MARRISQLCRSVLKRRCAVLPSVYPSASPMRHASTIGCRPGRKPTLLTDAIPLNAYAPERNGDPYAGFEPRIVPENVTLLPKSTAQTTGGNAWNERTIPLKKGDSVAAILRDMGATPEEVKAIA